MKHSFLFTVVFLCISLGYIFPQNNTYKNIIGKINTITEENSKVQIDVQIPEVKDSTINAELNKLIKSQIINFEKENFPPGKEKPFLRMLAGYSGFKDRIVTFIFKTSISAGENNSMEFLIPFSFDI
ncbi:MAG: hypothetical protein Q8903_15425, partial [Bacteroidota bacterium]|nr:hypothetical protein [Bacteroidota bacterium]